MRSILERENMARSLSAGDALVSSISCCNSQKTMVVQEDGPNTGARPTRYNLSTDEHMCRSGKTGPAGSARSGDKTGSRANVTTAFRNYNNCRRQAPTGDIEAELEATEAALRSVLRAHAQCMKKRLNLTCCDETPICQYTCIGYAFEQSNNQADSVSCTTCPLCSNMTRYSTKLFGVNGFSCGQCQSYIYARYAELTAARCIMCDTLLTEADRMAKQSKLDQLAREIRGIPRQWSLHCKIVDDVTIPGLSWVRECTICQVCSVPELRQGTGLFTLSELKYWSRHLMKINNDMLELVDMPHVYDYLAELERAQRNISMPMPALGSTKAPLVNKNVVRTGIGKLRFSVAVSRN